MSILYWVKVDVGHRLDDREETVAGVELRDLIGELETLEDATGGRREAVYVRNEVRRDVLGIPEQPVEGVRARVVQRMLPLRIGGLAEQTVHCRLGHLLRV